MRRTVRAGVLSSLEISFLPAGTIARDDKLCTESYCFRTGGPQARLRPVRGLVMRLLLTLIVVIGGLWAIDTFAYGGRYGRLLWSEAAHRGQLVRDEVAYRLRGLNR
jgi:hypothetical protein